MSLVERKRQLVRDELTEAALRLLAFQGFEETTIDQMAAAAGVSRRTFFRYFSSKEDVIIEFLSDLGRKLSAALSSRPLAEPPKEAVQNALRVFTDNLWEHPEKSRRLTEIMVNTPALLARYLERQLEWKASLAADLSTRMGTSPPGDVTAPVLVAVAFAAFDTALIHWVQQSPDTDLNALVDACFAVAFPPT
ncbi:TetR family transcriptional regulator [Dactylosporangium sucinum]|uniref:TetR family transcriptional regulator n=1 Tax=Dactylosporangium sucinum TaxID=1424081 RepID=A0A917X2B6_9ACTN|nr:TetR family transcriptional regulator [Dactylosporangium sucinum]GGM56493.1 TetR family transcriptional regulator [Dactylosporangium sucinum]